MDIVNITQIALALVSLVLSGLAIKFTRDARRYRKQAEAAWERVRQLHTDRERDLGIQRRPANGPS
jgi:hypothetical protein